MLGIRTDINIPSNLFLKGVKDAQIFHGHLCPGVFNGAKMAVLAQLLLDYPSLPSDDLIIVVEIDRCLSDALMAITGCRLGRRTMKLENYGKFGATFLSLKSRQGIRIGQRDGVNRDILKTIDERGINKSDLEKTALAYLEYPWQKHFSLELVDFTMMEKDLPGDPKEKVNCSKCKETIMDGHQLERDGRLLCVPCHRRVAQP